ncbi:MAG: V-type ATP synthase subunit I [Methanobacteriota archaeon]|nr:MAG: V-type ATP synthase subunit I [Euryarchaeota archaeon]
MLRPVPMTRALIVGPRNDLEAIVEKLYALKVLHIVDHKEGEEDLAIGKPLETAAEASEVLVKLRSIASVLQIKESEAEGVEPIIGDVRQKILALELNISEEDAAKKKTQALIGDLQQKIDAITPLAQLPLSLEDYRGYETLEVFVGRVPHDIEGLETITPLHEGFSAAGYLAVFVVKDKAASMREFLAQRGFTAVPVPEGEGNPHEILVDLLSEKARWQARLGEIEARLATLRERYAGFLTAAKAHLEVVVEKAEAPLRFAVTDHTFLVEGWVPERDFSKVSDEIGGMLGVFVSELETTVEHESGQPEEPPVLLQNPRPAKPFEMLINMYGTPSYRELDPTFVFYLAFPMMFGIMVGDAGYGLVWMVYGLWLFRRWKSRPWDFWKNLLVGFIWGGFWAFVFGTFVFAEAFGIPFHAPVAANLSRAEAFNWSDNILHVQIPIEPFLEKLHQVSDFIVLSIAIAYLHLGTGFLIGVVNEARHSKRHAAGKVGWFLILTGLFTVIMDRAARWPGLGQTIWNGPLGWFPKAGISMPNLGFTDQNPIPMLSLYLLGIGVVAMLVTEGPLHIMEVFGLLANVVSYARLAGIGVAEEAVIFALNTIGLNFLVFPWIDSGNIVSLIAGLVVLFLSNLLIFLLSTISGTIQALRLHYVEFFIKFYHGTGTLFRPFGVRPTTEV